MDELNRELKSQAIHLGLCREWQEMWNVDWSMEKMIGMMYRGLDFCLEHHWPSNDFIIKHFDLTLRRANNIFINDRCSVNNPQESLILGTADITVRYNGRNHGNIHVRDDAHVRLYAKNVSFVIVHLYERARIDAVQTDGAKVVLVKHSPDVRIGTDGDVKIREEYDYLK